MKRVFSCENENPATGAGVKSGKKPVHDRRQSLWQSRPMVCLTGYDNLYPHAKTSHLTWDYETAFYCPWIRVRAKRLQIPIPNRLSTILLYALTLTRGGGGVNNNFFGLMESGHFIPFFCGRCDKKGIAVVWYNEFAMLLASLFTGHKKAPGPFSCP